MVKIKIAILSDIHGNCVALREVIKDAQENNVDKFLVLGDLVNDLPFGNETLAIVKDLTDIVLKGNKEQYLIEYDTEKYNWKNIQFRTVKFMYNELTRENIEYIKTLPHSMSLEDEGVKLLIAHGSPESVEEQLHQDSREQLDYYTQNLNEDVLIVGHTHDKMWYENINGKLVVNAGCLGVSPYYTSLAEYVILDINNGKIDNIDLRHVKYDLEIIKQKIIESGILSHDKVLMNLSFCGINGNGIIRHKFFKEAKELMLERSGKWYKDDAKGIFTYFKLFDDDIWLGLAEKYKDYFVF